MSEIPEVLSAITADLRSDNDRADQRDAEKAKFELEQMVDRFSVRQVVDMLSEICAEKAEHIRVNWQDFSLAARWQAKAAKLDRVSNSLKKDF